LSPGYPISSNPSKTHLIAATQEPSAKSTKLSDSSAPIEDESNVSDSYSNGSDNDDENTGNDDSLRSEHSNPYAVFKPDSSSLFPLLNTIPTHNNSTSLVHSLSISPSFSHMSKLQSIPFSSPSMNIPYTSLPTMLSYSHVNNSRTVSSNNNSINNNNIISPTPLPLSNTITSTSIVNNTTIPSAEKQNNSNGNNNNNMNFTVVDNAKDSLLMEDTLQPRKRFIVETGVRDNNNNNNNNNNNTINNSNNNNSNSDRTLKKI